MVGEHIRAQKGGRWNHAIDCGDETVIHLASDDAMFRSVRRSYRPDFVQGAEVVEVVTHRERTFPANEVVARAYSRISDPGLAAMFRDSEAFAEWCVTGRLPPQTTARSGPALAPAPQPAAPQPAAPEVEPAPPAAPAAPPARKKARAKAKGAAASARPARARTARAKAPASRGAAKKRKASKPVKKAAKRKVARKPARGGARPRRSGPR